MPNRRRIVIYRAARWAGDDEFLAALGSASGLDPAALGAQLAKLPAVYLPAVDEDAADELEALLETRGLDFDVDPAPPPAEHVEWLEGEIPKWVKRGFVPRFSLPGLYWSYGLEPPAEVAPAAPVPKERDPSFLVRAVLTIGAVLVGLGLILFIASNWQKIPPGAKIGGALALTLAALHTGYRLRFVRGPYPKLSGAFLLIALFGIGGVVTLIAQIYHVLAEPYLLPLVWGSLCLPVALFLRFRPALYFTSALWLVSYLRYPESHDHLPWFYVFLLLGFLVPYAIAVGDRFLYWVHVGVVLFALAATPPTKDFWLCTAWLAGLVVLAIRDRRPIFDWLLSAAFFLWGANFLLSHFELPNVFYLAPLGWFFHRARRRQDNWFLLATVAHALVWLLTFLLQLGDRFDLEGPTATGLLLWGLATGVLLYGWGAWLEDAAWRIASIFLRVGGAALALFVVYTMSFRFYDTEPSFFESPLFLGATVASLGAGLALLLRGAGAAARPGRRRGVLFLCALLTLALALTVALPPTLAVHVVLFNLILFSTALLWMLEGHHGQSLLWYNLGIGLFVVLIVSRYFDTFVDLLPRSVFFVLGGVFLIVWAVLVDRQRRRHLASEGADGA